MYRARFFLKKILTPVTIMLVPHGRGSSRAIRMPVAAVVASVFLFLVGAAYSIAVSVRLMEFENMRERVSFLSEQFHEMKGTMLSLRQAERDFRKLFSVKSKYAVLEEADFADAGSLDMEVLREQIDATMESVLDIRKYISEQKDLYLATPAGLPVDGPVSSAYGSRKHPVYDEKKFHSGVDVSIPPGTDVKVTANGIVSFAGWTENSGNVVVVEHGYGLSTAYAHNRKAVVKVGRKVARGDVIALSGSTGVSTGPHVHYEIWKNGRHVDPAAYPVRR